MAISASMVKELRERTGAGMMECKKALTEAGGDMDAAVEAMRISGLAKADKKSGNTAAEGVVAIKLSADGASFGMVEINSQTDFAAKAEDFMAFTDKVVSAVLEQQPEAIDTLVVDGQPVEEARKTLVAKIGENIQVRRSVSGKSSGGVFGEYLHGVRIGVVCEVSGGDAELARDIAMHIAASRPVCVDETGVPAELLEKEKAIFAAEAAESGKPPEIVEKMVGGRIRKYLAEITLVGQPFVKNPDQTIAQLLKEKGATVVSFHRLEVGEGIEKKVENFAEEVMAQVRGS
ncbi:translation elongation factor Ts [Granulosicoccus antarcticus]|uniref:Elongation factor Ts n=1 Tax=Granulosicoccus antarcticus IMCC3135 TaxID=1192854 RepID=A0A2Z2P3I4_9GAMM|nr:translation elongation factor Ts [Granulosicoccus antarcticus]ASJ75167.1 Elongation factor Ts [Granulosicoccus antarcticus IMCC3135]